MNFHWPLFRKPEPHTQVRYVSATHAEDIAARARRLDKRLELAVYIANSTPEQRRQETQLYWDSMRGRK